MLPMIAAIENDREQEAIEHIFEQYYPRMKAIAINILGNEPDAEDAAMNAVAYMCRHPELFLDYTSKKTISLIYLCARHAAIDIYRKNQLRSKHIVFPDEESMFFEQIPDTDPSIVEIVISRDNQDLVMRAIDQLDEMYRTPILLHYNHQLRNTEIAELLHMDVNKVNGRIFRAKKMLGKILTEMGYTYE